MSEVLKPFFLQTHIRSNHDLYLIRKCDLVGKKNLSMQLSELCEDIQDKIWNKKFSIQHNSVERDILLIAVDNETREPTAFFSTSFILCENISSVMLYHSDTMILPKARGKGLLKYFFYLTNNEVLEKYSQLSIFNIVASGYIHIFKCFEQGGLFSKVNWQEHKDIKTNIDEILKVDFGDLQVEASGKLKAGWHKQSNGLESVWPSETAKQFKFPLDIDYFNGDVLVRVYKLVDNKMIGLE